MLNWNGGGKIPGRPAFTDAIERINKRTLPVTSTKLDNWVFLTEIRAFLSVVETANEAMDTYVPETQL